MARVAVLLPPEERVTLLEWLRVNLFDGWLNTGLTVLTGFVLWRLGAAILLWARDAHWAVVVDNLRLWLIGLMPVELAWRAYWAGGLVATAVGLTVVGSRAHVASRVLVALWGSILVASVWIMSPIPLDQIGGLYLTLLLAVFAIGLSFPIGVFVGLGRVSRLPVIRGFAIVYIEAIRGIPLITVLLWFSVFVTLVSGDALSKVERAMIALIIFSSAYVGEIVRAGVQSVPPGQVEAARAVGLSAVQTMRSIVLPQAVKNMLPALVGQFISLFKDTSLTVIIGLSELVGTGKSLLAITDYLHDVYEVYTFALVVFFVFSYTMSSGSRLLEKRLGLGER